MEIIDNNSPQRSKQNAVPRPRNLFLGITLILTGMLWLLYNLGWLNSALFELVFSWQVLVILIGGYLLVLRQWTVGSITCLAGVILVAIDQLNLPCPPFKIILPLLFIAVGIGFILARRRLF